MSDGWRWDPRRLRADLEGIGYDVTVEADGVAQRGSLTARRDRADRAHLLVVDAGGRFRAEVAVVVDVPGGTVTLAGVPLRVVTETRRTTTMTGLIAAPDQFLPLVAALERLAPPVPLDSGDVDSVPDGEA